MVTASAPVYVVWIWIGGGMIEGNWAIGSPGMATRARTIVTIAMAIATIGLSMKKRDMRPARRGRSAPRGKRGRPQRVRREGRRRHPVLQGRHADALTP